MVKLSDICLTATYAAWISSLVNSLASPLISLTALSCIVCLGSSVLSSAQTFEVAILDSLNPLIAIGYQPPSLIVENNTYLFGRVSTALKGRLG